MELEKKYWEGMEEKEYETVRNLTSFPCIVAGKNGVHSIDEATFKKMFESGEGDKIKVLNFSDFHSQQLDDNNAVTAYLIELGIAGEEKQESSKCACTSVWIKKEGKWLCTLHTESELSR